MVFGIWLGDISGQLQNGRFDDIFYLDRKLRISGYFFKQGFVNYCFFQCREFIDFFLWIVIFGKNILRLLMMFFVEFLDIFSFKLNNEE